MRPTFRFLIALCICCAVPAAASAQTIVRANEWSRGTTLDGFAGAAVDSAGTGSVIGGAAGWEITPRLALEGSGSWLDFGEGTTGFGGAMKVRFRLFGQRTVDPFVQAGVGLYRASFGVADRDIPDFYARRFTPARFGRTFTDPTVIGGAGVNVFVNRHLSIRPDVEAVVVMRHGRSHVMTNVAVHAVYHFESHPVTPGRR